MMASDILTDALDALDELERAQDALLDDARGDGLPSATAHEVELAHHLGKLRARLQCLAPLLDGVTP